MIRTFQLIYQNKMLQVPVVLFQCIQSEGLLLQHFVKEHMFQLPSQSPPYTVSFEEYKCFTSR